MTRTFRPPETQNLKNAIGRRQLLLGAAGGAATLLNGCMGPPFPIVARATVGGPVEGWVRSFAVSPDGTRVAFEAKELGDHVPTSLFVANRMTGECIRYELADDTQPADRRYYLRMPVFSPDGESIAVAAHRARFSQRFPAATVPSSLEYTNIAVLSLAGGRAKRFGDSLQYHVCPTFSRDGAKIACLRTVERLTQDASVEAVLMHRFRLYEYDLHTGTGEEFASVELNFADGAIDYSPEADAIYWCGDPPLKPGDGALVKNQSIATDPARRGIWKIARGQEAANTSALWVPRSFNGPSADQLCGVAKDGEVFVDSTDQKTKNAAGYFVGSLFRVRQGRGTLVAAGVPGTESARVSLNERVFAGHVVFARPVKSPTQFEFLDLISGERQTILVPDLISRARTVRIRS